ncbi:hypothetical protein M885DRAFT_549339 [Pelagophyceae sp. CCMP2097]|nr:hypothetical protein M885DRAFT_549339 [Pelagophyceae sp. CCMP2097]
MSSGASARWLSDDFERAPAPKSARKSTPAARTPARGTKSPRRAASPPRQPFADVARRDNARPNDPDMLADFDAVPREERGVAAAPRTPGRRVGAPASTPPTPADEREAVDAVLAALTDVLFMEGRLSCEYDLTKTPVAPRRQPREAGALSTPRLDGEAGDRAPLATPTSGPVWDGPVWDSDIWRTDREALQPPPLSPIDYSPPAPRDDFLGAMCGCWSADNVDFDVRSTRQHSLRPRAEPRTPTIIDCNED